jgi:hypothetical protein
MRATNARSGRDRIVEKIIREWIVAADLVIRRYDETRRAEWDAFVRRSKNGTFLFLRDYMEYHSDRFQDHSLLVLNGADIVALLPANRSGDDIYSHQGLTYGGLVTDESMTTPRFLEVFTATIEHLRGMKFRNLYYKVVPAIYHRFPAEEDRYSLFLVNANLYRRDVLSVVPLPPRIAMQARRRRGATKAAKHGVVVSSSQDWPAYWRLLSSHLKDRFGAEPIHTLAEIERLRTRFPDNIRLHVASLDDEILTGVVIYESPRVAHVQYICSSETGRELGALDMLFAQLLNNTYSSKAFFDFGMSNTEEGRALNDGLIGQKEGFGARAIAHDFYQLQL